jgi:hypothetical protein
MNENEGVYKQSPSGVHVYVRSSLFSALDSPAPHLMVLKEPVVK